MKSSHSGRRTLSFLLAALTLLTAIPLFAACKKSVSDLKIGILREDDTSGEASAWERYLRSLASDYGFTVDFTTTNSSSAEVSAINTYASKGYRAILLFSDDDIVASVTAAAAKKMYVVCPTGHPTDAQIEQLRGNEYYLGSVAPTADNEFRAGYDMAQYFVTQKGQDRFTIFGGATAYGSEMHIQRLSGILAYLCEDAGTSYQGVKGRTELAAKVAGVGVDPSKFVSDRYRITGYMDGFAFDDAFSTKLTNSLEQGGTCVLSVGAGDTVSKIAYGITSSSSKLSGCLVGGVDAITESYAACFDLGYAYDCGKFASAMAPGIILILAAVNGDKILDENGYAPKLGMNYWIATSKQQLNDMLASDNEKAGYCYNRAVIDHYVAEASYAELAVLCSADYAASVAIHDRLNGK